MVNRLRSNGFHLLFRVRNVYLNPHPRINKLEYELKDRWDYQTSLCPKCGSGNIKFDFGRIINFDTTAICNECGYTWVWQGTSP